MDTKSLPSNQDLNIREFFAENDAALVKFMDDASIIKAQRDALQVLNNAALAQTLRASEKTAAKEEKERADEKELPVKTEISSTKNGDPDASRKMKETARPEPPSLITISLPVPPDVDAPERYTNDEAAARLLARGWGVASLQGALLQNPDITPTQHQFPVSSSSLLSPTSSTNSSMTSVSSLSSSASAAARKTTASAAPNRMVPVTIPAEAFYSKSRRRKRGDSDSSSSSTSSSNTIFSSSRPSTATTSPGPSSQKSSSPPTPYIVPTSPTKERPNQSRLYTSASLVAAAYAQAQAQPVTKFTSASTSIPDNIKARGGSTIPTSTAMAHNSTIRVQYPSRRVPLETLHRRSISSSPERPHMALSSIVMPHKLHTSASTTITTAMKSSVSVPSSSTGAADANVIPSTSSYSSASSRSSSVTSSPGISPSTSATSTTSVSASSSWNLASVSPVIVTSASKVAAEKEREREKEREKSKTASKLLKAIPSSSASAAAKRVGASRPTPISVSTNSASGDHSRKRSITERCDRNEVMGSGLQSLSSNYTSACAVTTLPSPILHTTRGPEPISTTSSSTFSSHQMISVGTTASTCTSVKSMSASSSAASTPQRPLSPHTVRPRDAEELFSVPPIATSAVSSGVGPGGLGVGCTSAVGGQYQQQQVVGVLKAVVPVSWLSESDDEDDGVRGEEDEKEEEEDICDGKEEEKDGNDEEEEEEEVGEEAMGMKEGIDAGEVPVKEEEEEASFLGVYTATCSCSECGEIITYSPYDPKKSSYALSFALHTTCPRCSTLHCRGCASLATKCPRNRTGPGNNILCDIVNGCCPRVRTIAAFEALSAFDEAYLAEVNGGRKADYVEREVFIRDLISKPIGLQARRLEAVFVKCMNLLVDVFTSTPLSSSKNFSTTFVEHFEHSLMPEVIHFYLENTNVKDWITHSDLYTAILDLLRYMFEAGFGEGVIDIGLRRVGESRGLREWLLLGEETMKWVMRAKDEKEVRGGEMSRGLLKGGAERAVDAFSADKGEALSSTVVVEADNQEYSVVMGPLKSLIMGLEMHRTSLLEVLDKVTFMPTVEKLNVLCDGISQLVLGQVLGI